MRTVLYVVELDIFFPLLISWLAPTCAMLLTHHSVQGSIIDHRQNFCINANDRFCSGKMGPLTTKTLILLG